MSTPYLTLAQFKTRSLMPSEDVEVLEQQAPGFVEARIAFHQGRINGRLTKRYAVPFASPPEIVLGWLTDLVTFDCYKKRGWNPSSEQDAEIKADSDVAAAEVKEAADSQNGLFDLPLREADTGASGVSLGGPMGYSEASPYAWTTKQRDTGRSEDEA